MLNNRDLENGVRSYSRSSLKTATFDRSHTTFYWSAIVNIALSCIVFELFDVEWYRDLELWVWGHLRSFTLVPFESLGAVTYSPSIVTMALSCIISEIKRKLVENCDFCRAMLCISGTPSCGVCGVSVCMSVCVSVTFVNCVKTNEHKNLWHIAGSKRRCWLREKTTKYLWQDASTLRQRQQNSAFNCTQW